MCGTAIRRPLIDMRKQYVKWTVEGGGRSSLCLDGACSLQPVSEDNARSGQWEGGGADRHSACVWMVLCSLQPVSEDNARSGLWKGGRSSLCLDGASSLQPVSEDNARSGLWKGAGRSSLCLDGACSLQPVSGDSSRSGLWRGVGSSL